MCSSSNFSRLKLRLSIKNSSICWTNQLYQHMIVINKINNLLFFNVESLISGVSYGLTSYVYNFIFIKLNPVSLTKIFRIVIINWWRNQIYYTDSFNVFIIFFYLSPSPWHQNTHPPPHNMDFDGSFEVGFQWLRRGIALKAHQITPLFVERTPLIVHCVQPHRIHTRLLWQQVLTHMLLFVPW